MFADNNALVGSSGEQLNGAFVKILFRDPLDFDGIPTLLHLQRGHNNLCKR